jgi:thiol-disulfide isomerase/thioredoxin
MNYLTRIAACGLLLSFSVGAPRANRADEPAVAKPDAPANKEAPAASPGERDEKAVIADLRDAKEKLSAAMPSISAIGDADFRKESGAKLIPLVLHTSGLLKELAALEKDDEVRQGLNDDRCQYLALLVALGDDNAATVLEKDAAGNDAKNVVAKSALAVGRWWRNSKDAAAQEKILAAVAEMAKADPTSDKLLQTLEIMARVGAANDELAIKVVQVIRKTMKGDGAKRIAAELDPNGALRELVDKPLVVAGRTTAGKSLTTADWKGKVVLVDFWATWCGPCNAEIPRVKDLYKTYHAKGLEIVGVDCDSDDDTVNVFTKDKEMTWTQLREESQSEEPWHPLAKQWGVSGIPTMFLLDKKGVLRDVDARDGTDAKIAKLLAE